MNRSLRIACADLVLLGCLGVASSSFAQAPQIRVPSVPLPANLAAQKLQTENLRLLSTHLTGLGFKEGEIQSDRYIGKDFHGEYEMTVVERRLAKGQAEGSITFVEIKRSGKTVRYEVASTPESVYKVQLSGQVHALAASRGGFETNIQCLQPLAHGILKDRCSTCSHSLGQCMGLRTLKNKIGCIMASAGPCADCGWNVMVTVGCVLEIAIVVFG